MPLTNRTDIETELPRPWRIDNVGSRVVAANGKAIFNFDSFDWMVQDHREFLIFLVGTVNSFDELKEFYLRHLKVPVESKDLIKIEVVD